jgi:hypothetical protein
MTGLYGGNSVYPVSVGIVDGNQRIPKTICDALGICLVAYTDNGPLANFYLGGADYEIRGRLVTPNSVPPGSLTKTGPTNGTLGQPSNLTLSWGSSSLAGSYEYCLDTTDNNLCDSGMAVVAEKAHLKRESLYRMLSAQGNPALSNLLSILHGMGLKMIIQPQSTGDLVD